MDESALKILIDSLESCRSSLDFWLSFFTSLVTIGVVLEVVFVVVEYREELHDWRRGFVHPPEKPSTKLLVFGLFGATLVALGVAGEWYIDAKIGAVETRIKRANDDRAYLLSREAGDAKTSAEAAATALGEIQKKSDALNARLDAASLKLGMIVGRLAWRNLSPEEFIRAQKELLPFKGSYIVIGSQTMLGSDEEPVRFAKQVAKLFTDSGWNVKLTSSVNVAFLPQGIWCSGNKTPAGIAAKRFCERLPNVVETTVLPVDDARVAQILIRGRWSARRLLYQCQ